MWVATGSRKRPGFYLRTSEREQNSATTLIWAQWDPCQTSSLQNCEVIHLCYLKSLSLWWFVTTAIEDESRQSEVDCLACVLYISKVAKPATYRGQPGSRNSWKGGGSEATWWPHGLAEGDSCGLSPANYYSAAAKHRLFAFPLFISSCSYFGHLLFFFSEV